MIFRTSKRGGRHQSFTFVLIVFVLVLLLVGCSVFLRVTDIIVAGTEYYTPEEVIEASGLKTGTSLLTVNGSRTALKLTGELLYVKEIRIDRVFPGTVVINVTECSASAYVRSNTDFWTLDNSGKVLEKVSNADTAGLYGIRGISRPVFDPGHFLTTETNANVAESVSRVVTALEKTTVHYNARWIDFSDMGNITIDCGSVTVELGSLDRLEDKLLLADAAYTAENPQNGVIDVSSGDSAHYIPPHS